MIYGKIVDVISKEIYPGKITICDGKISAIERLPESDDLAARCVDYIMPGFVDSHLHIESTLMVPQNYARMAVANGVVAAVCDPHEIANVLGTEGVDFMIRNGKNVRFNFSYAVPSCVPSTPFETAGAVLGPQDVAQMLEREEVVALAEMMNVPGVVFGDEQVLAKIEAAHKASKPIDGHAPQVTGEMLEKYVATGISTDHECETTDEAKEKIALGMKILIREGSAACDFENLHTLIAEFPDQVLFCSDDMYPDDIDLIGYINGLVKRSLAEGMPMWETLSCACVNPVRHYGLKSGLLQVGDQADFVVVRDLKNFDILSTYIQGEEVYSSDSGVKEDVFIICEEAVVETPNQFCAEKVTPEMMKVKWEDAQMKVMRASEGSLITGVKLVTPEKDADGNVVTDIASGISKIVVYNRYTPSVPQVAYIKGFGLKRGAIASTIAHDSHNIIAVGSNDTDLANAINLLIDRKGGICACEGDESVVLPLPVAGLMTTLKPQEVAEKHNELKYFTSQLGCKFKAPFMTLAFMALPVIPELKLTDKGLFDANHFRFTSVWGGWLNGEK